MAIRLRGVRKVYRQRQRPGSFAGLLRSLWRPTIKEVEALKGVDLDVTRGEIVAYAGPNGAGKSTTIKLLAGLLAPDTGTVEALGMDPLRQRTRYVGRIGVVFGQRTELWWDQPVAASFEWKRVVWEIPRERYNRMSAFVRDLLGLDEFFNSLARELSLGQRMRADLGLALLHEPDVLFLDEPTLGLDVLAKRNILRAIKEINQERRTTVVVTSHDMGDLEELAGRIVLIHRGSIAFDGPFDRLRRDYAERRRLLLETGGAAPVLEGAELVRSEAGRHEYVFDARQVKIAGLLAQASSSGIPVLDVETHRESIDELIADIYESWLRDHPASGS